MVSEIMGGYGANLIIAIAAVAIALFLLFFVSRIFKNRGIARRMRSGTGPRLAVLDSTPVDTSRRLVLIRRDDVEHLILIGGPSDLVIESRIEKKSEVPSAIAPAPEPRQHQSAVAVAPIVTRRETSVTAVPTRPQITEPVPKEIDPRQAINQAPASRPAEAVRMPKPPVEDHSTSSTSLHSAAAANETGRNIEDVLDDARDRVFGHASGIQPMAAQASHREEPPIQPNDEPQPSARFEDFLDTEIAGDLSAVTPGKVNSPASQGPVAAPRTEPAKQEASSIDSDMARLLGELSAKR